MHKRLILLIICSGFSFFLSRTPINAQLLQDSTAMNLIKEDIAYIYNQQFREAHEVYNQIVQLYPSHPIVYLLRGISTYWENYPMLHTSPAHDSYEEDMKECINLSEKNKNSTQDAEYLLTDLCARAMLLMYYDDNNLIMEVTPLIISTYKYIRRAFDYTSDCADLYYFTGIYNYYREDFPKLFPVYKSLAFIFPHGDPDGGLNEFQYASVNGIVLRGESCSLLTWIYLGFENNLTESSSYCRILCGKYPQNVLYLETYIRNLLLQKNYDEAERLIARIPGEEVNKFFQAQLLILKGILQEKRYHNNNQAQLYYKNGIGEISKFGDYGNEYAAYAYFGLSRLSNENSEKHSRKTYRKEAMKLAEFKKIDFDN